ncbi:unnamed protein product [Absidia cylindrospora]
MAVIPSNKIATWANSLAFESLDWTNTTKKCIKILNEGELSEDPHDLLAASVLFNCAPRLAKRIIDEPSEDTFVHVYLDAILDGIFSTEPLLKQEWANGWLSSSKLELNKVFKPDWVVYVKPWYRRCDLAVCEVKPPGKMSPPPFSDYVKLGFEMKQMLTFLSQQGVDEAFVLGILVDGFTLKTYYMDTKGENIFRMIQLGKARLISETSELGVFPVLFKTIVQLKNLAVDIGRKIQDEQLQQAKGKRKGSGLECAGLPAWKKFKKHLD